MAKKFATKQPPSHPLINKKFGTKTPPHYKLQLLTFQKEILCPVHMDKLDYLKKGRTIF